MDILGVIQTIIAFLSLLVSLFVASKVVKLEQHIEVQGEHNVVAGRDASVDK